MWVAVVCVLTFVHGGGGVTKSGIAKFWTDDYKVFEQVYGKTSDKDLYGATLPPSIGYGISNLKKKTSASDKKEGFIDNSDFSIDLDSSFGERYAKLFTKDSFDDYEKLVKPATSSFNFVSYSDFKPISQQSDPEMYDYLKHLEHFEKEQNNFDKDQNIEFPKGIGGFKPYLNYAVTNPEGSQAYKNIQDILDAHENNKGKKTKANAEKDEDKIKYINYGRYPSRKKTSPRLIQSNYITKPRCWSGRCRNRASNSVRTRTRPYIRKIKQRIVEK